MRWVVQLYQVYPLLISHVEGMGVLPFLGMRSNREMRESKPFSQILTKTAKPRYSASYRQGRVLLD